MAITFKIDSDTIKSPFRQVWVPREPLDYAHTAAPLYSAKRTCTLEWPAMSISEYNIVADNDDGATHTVDIYTPDFNTEPSSNQYTGVYVRMVSGGLEAGGVVIGASIEIWNITA